MDKKWIIFSRRQRRGGLVVKSIHHFHLTNSIILLPKPMKDATIVQRVTLSRQCYVPKDYHQGPSRIWLINSVHTPCLPVQVGCGVWQFLWCSGQDSAWGALRQLFISQSFLTNILKQWYAILKLLFTLLWSKRFIYNLERCLVMCSSTLTQIIGWCRKELKNLLDGILVKKENLNNEN